MIFAARHLQMWISRFASPTILTRYNNSIRKFSHSRRISAILTHAWLFTPWALPYYNNWLHLSPFQSKKSTSVETINNLHKLTQFNQQPTTMDFQKCEASWPDTAFISLINLFINVYFSFDKYKMRLLTQLVNSPSSIIWPEIFF